MNFLEEYEALCRKYSLIIMGCGYCGSPWLSKISPDYSIEDNVKGLKDGAEGAGVAYRFISPVESMELPTGQLQNVK